MVTVVCNVKIQLLNTAVFGALKHVLLLKRYVCLLPTFAQSQIQRYQLRLHAAGDHGACPSNASLA